LSSLCDTHCHLYLDDYAQDLDEVIQRAREAGVGRLLIPGIDIETSQKAVELACRYADLMVPAAGIHPNYSRGIGKDEVKKLEVILHASAEIRAIGEIGLDYYRDRSSKDDQIAIFQSMLDLAEQFNLPVCLHVRESAEDIIHILDGWYADLYRHNHPLAQNPGVFHSFDGSDLILKWGMDHEFMFGINGMVTYPKSQALREKLPRIGMERLLTETDSPYLTPQPHRGKRNEPAHVKYIVEEIGKVLDCPVETIIESTGSNAERLFGSCFK
jgi:TatD DNase family protein